MSVRTVQRLGFWPGMGAFALGFGLIVSASILNIAHDRIFADQTDKLPEFLGYLYLTAGKWGVTVVFVTLGLLVLLAGVVVRRLTEQLPWADLDEADPLSGTPHFPTPSDEGAPRKGGTVVLETRKYVSTPQPGLSALLPQPAPRRGGR